MKKSYKVLRQHDGDRQYYAGEIREADESDVLHLVNLGVLVEFTPPPTRKLTKEK